jgi:hypothetical protein
MLKAINNQNLLPLSDSVELGGATKDPGSTPATILASDGVLQQSQSCQGSGAT